MCVPFSCSNFIFDEAAGEGDGQGLTSRTAHVTGAAWLRWANHGCVMITRKETGSKVVLRWRMLWLRQDFIGWSEHAATQRYLALTADKMVRMRTRVVQDLQTCIELLDSDQDGKLTFEEYV